MKIGVFDSGVGGLSVARAIERELPGYEIVLREDRANLPYGTKTPDELFRLIVPILTELIGQGCKIIVVACNTVSTTLITRLRAKFPDTRLVAIEPMVKPAAALTKSKIIAVCATPATLASRRYAELKKLHAAELIVLEPDCADWAAMVEYDQIDEDVISRTISEVLIAEADVIVLGCTHYHWIEQQIQAMAAGRATVLQPEMAVIQQLKRVLKQLA